MPVTLKALKQVRDNARALRSRITVLENKHVRLLASPAAELQQRLTALEKKYFQLDDAQAELHDEYVQLKIQIGEV